MAYDFNGKKVWVTGASSGIGRCLVDQLHEKGAHVFVSARNTEKLSENFSGKERITILPGDLTSADVNKNIVADI
ncbi:SDR family NAD(P)-dependent oxidoreductase, partial [Cycloclasticus pugetii]